MTLPMGTIRKVYLQKPEFIVNYTGNRKNNNKKNQQAEAKTGH